MRRTEGSTPSLSGRSGTTNPTAFGTWGEGGRTLLRRAGDPPPPGPTRCLGPGSVVAGRSATAPWTSRRGCATPGVLEGRTGGSRGACDPSLDTIAGSGDSPTSRPSGSGGIEHCTVTFSASTASDAPGVTDTARGASPRASSPWRAAALSSAGRWTGRRPRHSATDGRGTCRAVLGPPRIRLVSQAVVGSISRNNVRALLTDPRAEFWRALPFRSAHLFFAVSARSATRWRLTTFLYLSCCLFSAATSSFTFASKAGRSAGLAKMACLRSQREMYRTWQHWWATMVMALGGAGSVAAATQKTVGTAISLTVTPLS
mmetsp:Transcript_38182/g.100006  ORF Transcript_38182/g.100006 Transcript_38182/m.100006 type:complete len:316 (-) Transcript_38182:439-1386(-)